MPARRLKKEHAAIRQRLLDDAELLRQGIAPPGADRYMAAVCPDKTTAFDYLAPDTILCAGEAGRVQETLRAFLFQTRQDVTAAVEAGLMAGAFGDLTLAEPELETALSGFALLTLAARFVYQQHYQHLNMSLATMNKINVAIVGAGHTGAMLAEDMLCNSASHYKPVCFVDVSPEKIGGKVCGIMTIGCSGNSVAIRRCISSWSPPRSCVV